MALDDIVEFISDTKPEMWLGRTELVKSRKADKKKLYEQSDFITKNSQVR